mgnify:CR=1 FL=1
MIKEINHLCFDKDGVIIDVHAYWRHTTEIRAKFIRKKLLLTAEDEMKTIEAMGIDLITGRIKRKGPIGYHPRQQILKKLFMFLNDRSYKISMSELENYFIIIDNNQQESGDFKLTLLDGVKEFLIKNKNNFKMSVFTSDRKKNAEYAFDKLGIASFFKVILGGDSVINPKPHPQGINDACNKIKIKENKTAYISDTSSDLIMAKNAGLICKIGVLTGLGNKEDFNQIADLVFNDLKSLSEYLYAK